MTMHRENTAGSRNHARHILRRARNMTGSPSRRHRIPTCPHDRDWLPPLVFRIQNHMSCAMGSPHGLRARNRPPDMTERLHAHRIRNHASSATRASSTREPHAKHAVHYRPPDSPSRRSRLSGRPKTANSLLHAVPKRPPRIQSRAFFYRVLRSASIACFAC